MPPLWQYSVLNEVGLPSRSSSASHCLCGRSRAPALRHPFALSGPSPKTGGDYSRGSSQVNKSETIKSLELHRPTPPLKGCSGWAIFDPRDTRAPLWRTNHFLKKTSQTPRLEYQDLI